jgi:hypothetical protein
VLNAADGATWRAAVHPRRRVQHTARQGVLPSRGRGERKRVGQVARVDWLAGFLPHLIFELNYFNAN